MLGRRKPATTPAAAEPEHNDPDQRLAAAEQAVGVLLAELQQVREMIAEKERQRRAIIENDDDLAPVAALDRAIYEDGLRSEQLQHRLPALEQVAQEARMAAYEARWQAFRPRLAEVERQVVSAIDGVYDALRQAKDAHAAAQRAGFAGRLREFLAIPPSEPLNDFSLREFCKFAGQDRRPAAPAEDFTVMAIEPVELPPDPSFVPGPPDFAAIQNLDPQAAPRAVRILHNAQTSNLHIGLNRVVAGKEHVLPAKAALMLVTSGVAAYLDPDPVEALAVA